MSGARVIVVGTCDTKGAELAFVRDRLAEVGVGAVVVDVSTADPNAASAGVTLVSARDVAARHPGGEAAVFTGDRGTAVTAMAEALERYCLDCTDIAGVLGLGGSGGTAIVTRAMRALRIGLPKLMVSTVASGNVASYVGESDICMMYSVTDVAGLNRISRQILSNAAKAMAGMTRMREAEREADDRPAIGITMFGVTTPCVSQVTKALEPRHDCLIFHATGTGGRSMEKLAASHLIDAVIDLSTTEICDLLVGGIMAAAETRLAALADLRLAYLGSCGALDMVNFGSIETVPERFRDRNLYVHNPQITLMRTTPAENERIGRWIGERLNGFRGPVRFLIPEGGVSALDAPGQPFWDPEADAALFASLRDTFVQTPERRLLPVPHHINDPEFARAVVSEFLSMTAGALHA